MRVNAEIWGDTPAEAAKAARELADRIEHGEETARGNYLGYGYECGPHESVTHAPPEPHGWNEDSQGGFHFYQPGRQRALCGRLRTGGKFVERDPPKPGTCPKCAEAIRAKRQEVSLG